MVEKIQKENNIYFQCEECRLLYAEKEIAEKCQAWCAEHKSCNLEIIKYAIEDSSNA